MKQARTVPQGQKRNAGASSAFYQTCQLQQPWWWTHTALLRTSLAALQRQSAWHSLAGCATRLYSLIQRQPVRQTAGGSLYVKPDAKLQRKALLFGQGKGSMQTVT